MAVTTTATMTTTKINSNRERERNFPSASDSSELSSVTVELSLRLVISSESIGKVVVSCLLPSLVLKTEVGGMLFVKTISDVVVVNGTVQEFPIDGSLRSAA